MNLSGVDLSGADLSGVDLERSGDLSMANLSETNLRGADLVKATFWMADLRGADLSGAALVGADLVLASVGKANSDQAAIGVTSFLDMDLSVAKGLEAVFHHERSFVDIHTIYRSRGKIPEVFLRGCGVPDEFIAYIGAMVGRPIEFYSCFISYSTKDQEFAERLHADLQAKGVRCWFAPEEMKAGRKLHEQIDEAIRLHDKLLLILSEHSMSSEWVGTEILKARKREIEENEKIPTQAKPAWMVHPRGRSGCYFPSRSCRLRW